MTFCKLVLTTALLASPFTASASSRMSCNRVFASELAHYKTYIRPIPENDFLVFMRSNPAASLAWFKEYLPKSSEELNSLSKEHGYIGGDIKPDNVDVVRINDKRSIAVIDLDDGGVGPLVADLFHSLVYNRVWPTSLSYKEAIKAYQDGLNGKDLQNVVTLKQIWKDRSHKEYNYEKMAGDQETFFASQKLSSFESADPAAKSIYQRIEKQLLSEIRSIGEVIYFGVRVKTSGGSMDIPRYTFLIKDHKTQDYKIIEFKYQPSPSVAVLGSEQPSHEVRIKKLIEYYKPAGDTGNILGVLKTPDGDLLIREKLRSNFDAGSIPDSKGDQDTYRSYMLHMFHMIGEVHARQSPNYAKEFNKSFDLIEPELKTLVDDHVSDFKKEFESFARD